MLGQSTKKNSFGFSILELLIALMLMSVILSGAVTAVQGAQYWQLTATTAHEALQINKSVVNSLVTVSGDDFQMVSSTFSVGTVDATDPSNQSCLGGGLCYTTTVSVQDISSCAKELQVDVSWQLSLQHATNSVLTRTPVIHSQEIVAVGGDCLVTPPGVWQTTGLIPEAGTLEVARGNTGIDVYGDAIFITSAQAPYLRIYQQSGDSTIPPVLVGSALGAEVRLNDIDVIRDMGTGRLYAYVTQHTTSTQLAVFDVTDYTQPQLLTQLPLFGVDPSGSFPQGWRVMAYGGMLYVVSRETTGPELHIFSLADPRMPVENISARVNLNRTVNDMVVRDEVFGQSTRRFLYLAASADLKEVGVYDVTPSIPIEVAAVNLAGNADARALYLTGSTLYVGRQSNTASELYAFAINQLHQGQVQLLGSGEVGSEVLALGGAGNVLVVGVTKNGEELQLWDLAPQRWRTSLPQLSRLYTYTSNQLAPLGFDIGNTKLYLMSHSTIQPETIVTMHTP